VLDDVVGRSEVFRVTSARPGRVDPGIREFITRVTTMFEAWSEPEDPQP
jgi:hypothetical protein